MCHKLAIVIGHEPSLEDYAHVSKLYTAWLSQDAIAKRNNIDYGKLLEIVVLRATVLQVVFGSLCIMYIYNYSSNLFEFKSLISTFLSIHTILWGLVTLPLALVCSIIFKLTALRPIYG